MNYLDTIVTKGRYSRAPRPRNERLYQRLITEIAKIDTPSVQRSSAASRRQAYLRALAKTAPADRPGGGDTSILAQSEAGPAGARARMAHQAAVQRFRKPF